MAKQNPTSSSARESSYIEALTYRIVDEVANRQPLLSGGWGLNDKKLFERLVRKFVTDVMNDIQHRLYQHSVADLLHIAKQLNPEEER